MSGTWSGFTEEDIEKLKTGNTKLKAKIQSSFLPHEAKQVLRKGKTMKYSEIKTAIINDIPEDAKLSINKNENPMINILPTTENGKIENKIITSNTVNEKVTNDNITELFIIESKPSKLEEFETKQKLMKEQNRKRKELLSKTLDDRTRKTVEETRKLNEIKEEFKKLDALLSNDVSVLRHEIEVASIEFMEAQKRYHRIEKEFLEAKLNLHNKLERKELLTEHLCAIIEKNEERKAEKLSDLMGRLELDKLDEDEITKSSEELQL